MNAFKQVMKQKIKEYSANPVARRKLMEKFQVPIDPADLVVKKSLDA